MGNTSASGSLVWLPDSAICFAQEVLWKAKTASKTPKTDKESHEKSEKMLNGDSSADEY